MTKPQSPPGRAALRQQPTQSRSPSEAATGTHKGDHHLQQRQPEGRTHSAQNGVANGLDAAGRRSSWSSGSDLYDDSWFADHVEREPVLQTSIASLHQVGCCNQAPSTCSLHSACQLAVSSFPCCSLVLHCGMGRHFRVFEVEPLLPTLAPRGASSNAHRSSCWLQFRDCHDAYQTKHEVYFQLHQSMQGVKIKVEGLVKVRIPAASHAIAPLPIANPVHVRSWQRTFVAMTRRGVHIWASVAQPAQARCSQHTVATCRLHMTAITLQQSCRRIVMTSSATGINVKSHSNAGTKHSKCCI